MVGVIFLNRMGFIPSWVFGWISNDRKIQERQFQLALYGLFSFWAISRLIKLGVFGEAARATYERILLRLEIIQRMSIDEPHNRVCAVKNVRIAAVLVAFFIPGVFQSWRTLGKPLVVENSLYDLLFRIVLFSFIFFPVLFKFARCTAERVILGVLMTRIVTGWVFEYAPNFFNPYSELISQCYFVLSVIALLISLALLVSHLSRSTLPT